VIYSFLCSSIKINSLIKFYTHKRMLVDAQKIAEMACSVKVWLHNTGKLLFIRISGDIEFFRWCFCFTCFLNKIPHIAHKDKLSTTTDLFLNKFRFKYSKVYANTCTKLHLLLPLLRLAFICISFLLMRIANHALRYETVLLAHCVALQLPVKQTNSIKFAIKSKAQKNPYLL